MNQKLLTVLCSMRMLISFYTIFYFILLTGLCLLIFLMYLAMLHRVNVTAGLNEERMMMTGMHTVADIFCVGCGSIVGWKYVS